MHTELMSAVDHRADDVFGFGRIVTYVREIRIIGYLRRREQLMHHAVDQLLGVHHCLQHVTAATNRPPSSVLHELDWSTHWASCKTASRIRSSARQKWLGFPVHFAGKAPAFGASISTRYN